MSRVGAALPGPGSQAGGLGGGSVGDEMTDRDDFSEGTLNRFRAVSDHSLQRAGESLTTLLGHPVRLEVSDIRTLRASALPQLAAEASSGGLAGLRFQITGEAGGEMVLLLPLPTVFRMLRRLLGRVEAPGALSKDEQSAVQEVGNVLASSFLSELGDLLGRRLMPSPPELHLGDIPQLIQQVMEDVKGRGSEALVVQAIFEDPDRKITGRFFVLPEMASLLRMLRGTEEGRSEP